MKILFVFLILSVFLISSCKKGNPPQKMQKDELTQTLLLSHYNPKSIYKIPGTHIDKAKYPIVDVHSHPYPDNEEQIGQWVKTMDAMNIKKTIILSKSTGAKFDSIYALYSKYPDHFDIWCGFDYSGYDQPGYGPAAVAELERCFKAGAKGVGELGDKGNGMFYSTPGPKAVGMHIDDPRMDPLLEKCAELKMPINIHVTEPMWMYEPMDSSNDGLLNAYKWRRDNKGDELDHAGLIKTLENAVQKHPKTTFIACHFANCSHDLSILGALFDKYPNLFADNAARYAETAPIPRFVKAFYEKYQDRLLYGTDMGFNKEMYSVTFRILETEDEHFYEWHQFSYHWALNGFGLSDAVLLKVYSKNAQRILGL
jgi:uncharacterized protein